MKIVRIYCKSPVLSQGHSMNFSAEKYQLAYVPEARGYLINNSTLIPESNISEVVVEAEAVKAEPKSKK